MLCLFKAVSYGWLFIQFDGCTKILLLPHLNLTRILTIVFENRDQERAIFVSIWIFSLKT